MSDVFFPESFRHHTIVNVRFADLDAMGHVYHATFLTYMEQGRVKYLQDVLGWAGDIKALGIIVASVKVDYKAPLFFGNMVNVFTRCSRLGTKSFDLSYLLRRDSIEGEAGIVATGSTTLVAYDYGQRVTVAVPTEWREKSQDFEMDLGA